MGSFVIVMPATSYARELWRYGEPDLAERAARMSPQQCADVGERAGQMTFGEAQQLWPGGPSGHTSAILLAAIELLEGRPRPCARRRRLPEKSLPVYLAVSEEDRWAASELVADEVSRRHHHRD